MRKCLKKIGLFLVLSLVLVCCGCGATEERCTTLWVVTEKSKTNGMNEQIQQVIAAFEEDHPGITVELDILPTSSEERELVFRKIRSQLMAGSGPDILLLPTVNCFTYYTAANINEAATISYTQDMLLADPEQSMRTGIFQDISEFYDADEALGKENLQQTIMDAGTLGNARYILPLRYNFPALYMNESKLAAFGVNVEEVEKGILPLLRETLAAGSSALASGMIPSFCRTGGILALLSNPLDYSEERLALDAEELAEFLALYQGTETLAAGNHDGRNCPYIWSYVSPYTQELYINERGYANANLIPTDAYPDTIPATVGTLMQAANAAAIAIVEGEEGYRMAPLCGTDGQLAAWVTYYGAITAGCEYPEEAYDFLRRFLLEENQWEQNRRLEDNIGDWKVDYQDQFIEDGWPVRYKGFIEKAWFYLRRDVYRGGDDATGKQRARRIQQIMVTDADIPLLDAEIDRVYFGNAVEPEIAEYIRGMNDDDTGEALGAAHAEAAEEFISALEWNLLEG